MKVVSFKDGTYGIRRFNWKKWQYEFKDLTGYNNFWWPWTNTEAFNLFCKRPTLDDAIHHRHSITDMGTVVNLKKIKKQNGDV